MATKKESDGTALTSLFENIEEKGFGDVGAEDLRTPRVSIVQALSPQRQKASADYVTKVWHFCRFSTTKL